MALKGLFCDVPLRNYSLTHFTSRILEDTVALWDTIMYLITFFCNFFSNYYVMLTVRVVTVHQTK